MFVSYVVATYNCVDRVMILRETVASLNLMECEFCISDGGSVDGTVAALRDIPGVRLLRSGPDKGIYDAWNRVLDECRGEYISFIGVDDIPMQDFIALAKSTYNKGAKPRKVICGDVFLLKDGREREVKAKEEPALFFSPKPIFDIPHPGMLNHQSLFAKRRFDSSFKLAGDLDFYLSARSEINPEDFLYIEKVQARVDAEGVSRSSKAARIYLEEYKRVEQKHGVTLGYSDMRLKLINMLDSVPLLFSAIRRVSWFFRANRS